MNKKLNAAVGPLIAVFMCILGMTLLLHALKGDVYALVLLIAEVVLLLFQVFFCKGKMSERGEYTFAYANIVWSLAMFTWVLHRAMAL